MRRAEREGGIQLVLLDVDGDDLACPARGGAEQSREAHAAKPDDGDRLARPHLAGVHDRAYTRHHGAAKERCIDERHVGPDLHDGAAGYHRILGERADAAMVVDLGAVATESPCSRKQRPGQVRGIAGHTQRRPARGAHRAMAAIRNERHDDMVAPDEVVNVRTHLLHHAGSLVPQGYGHSPRPVAVDAGEIGMAHARRRDLHQDFAGSGRREVDGLDRKRPRLVVGLRQPGLTQNG